MAILNPLQYLREKRILNKYDRFWAIHFNAINYYLKISRINNVSFSIKKIIVEDMDQILSNYYQFQHNQRKQYEFLKTKYENGFNLYIGLNPNAGINEIIEDEKELVRYERNYFLSKKSDLINKSQEEFFTFSRKQRNTHLENWGCYPYNTNYNKIDLLGNSELNSCRVWQFFYSSFSSNLDIDVSLYPSVKVQFELVGRLLSNASSYKDFVYDPILNYVKSLQEFNPEVRILFSQDDKYHSNDIHSHFKYLADRILEDRILNKEYIFWDYESLISTNAQQSNDKVQEQYVIVIIELVSSNSHLKTLCSDILNNFNSIPNIVFISLEKEYDDDELTKILLDKKLKIEEQKRIEKDQQEKKKKIISELKLSVDKWFSFNNGLKYFYPYNYYPTTCEFDATNEEWGIRKMIWSFKNDPSKISEYQHNAHMDEVVNVVSRILNNTFGSNLSHLTLVCIPASTIVINNARYEEFSNLLCSRLGIENGFSHIRIITERIPRHLGGAGQIELEFDSEFFYEKNILLFDDVITKGNSMLGFQKKMISLGANVIACLSIGKTKHERDASPIIEFNNGNYTT